MKTLYYRFLYRPVQRAMHRYNLHHMRTLRLKDDDGIHTIVKCDWCGLSATPTWFGIIKDMPR